jgi:hypothetical protein
MTDDNVWKECKECIGCDAYGGCNNRKPGAIDVASVRWCIIAVESANRSTGRRIASSGLYSNETYMKEKSSGSWKTPRRGFALTQLNWNLTKKPFEKSWNPATDSECGICLEQTTTTSSGNKPIVLAASLDVITSFVFPV